MSPICRALHLLMWIFPPWDDETDLLSFLARKTVFSVLVLTAITAILRMEPQLIIPVPIHDFSDSNFSYLLQITLFVSSALSLGKGFVRDGIVGSILSYFQQNPLSAPI